jgi:Fe-S-cluster containining protein
MTIQYELSYIKQHYRDIFLSAQENLSLLLLGLQQDFYCSHCGPVNQDNLTDKLFNPTTHNPCPLKDWQQACLKFIEQEIGGSILAKLDEINTERNKVQCHHCGVCCRFASSEFSFEQLLEKAANGDEFAKQFTSIFLPYPSVEAAHKRFPDMVDSILKEVRSQQGQADHNPTQSDTAPVHFYHCPYIGEDNKCTIYGKPKRPEICSTYPDTPLTFIYQNCAWKPWKDTYYNDSLASHASIELGSFYIEKIKAGLSN